ncbi:MAG: helix-turn-helix domain-containing protein [Anaerolineae bacterium]|nr:helix-turn-helix domain-containing protein [Anaerolineae bacterium]
MPVKPESRVMQEFASYYHDLFTMQGEKPSRAYTTTRVLADYLKGALLNRGWSAQVLAQKMGYKSSLAVQAVLTGEMEVTRLTDDFLERLAQALGYDLSLIHALVGLHVAHDPQLEERHQLQHQLLERINQILHEMFDERHSADICSDDDKRHLYDRVISQIGQIIAHQRTAIRDGQKALRNLARNHQYAPAAALLESLIHMQQLDLQLVERLTCRLSNPEDDVSVTMDAAPDIRLTNDDFSKPDQMALRRLIHRVKYDYDALNERKRR